MVDWLTVWEVWCGVVVIVWVMGAWDGAGRDGMPSPTLSAREWAGGSGGGYSGAVLERRH